MAMIKFFVTVFVVFTLIISILMLPLYFYRKKKDPDNKKNTVRRLIITVFVGVLLFTGICTFWFIRFGKALIEKDDNGSGSISIIGGVDGPTTSSSISNLERHTHSTWTFSPLYAPVPSQ